MTERQRLRAVVRGAVQGVGFRPFVYRLAAEMGLPGWVNNSPQGVFLEVEGRHDLLESFLLRLERDRPPRASIQSLEYSILPLTGFVRFEIRPSDASGARSAVVLPDIATCPDCLRELFDPGDRRFRYPFTNCTNCGPRFSIIQALPYDRPNTTMSQFIMCADCRREYDDPADRRFHAQPTACPACGPQVELWSQDGQVVARRHEAMDGTVEAIRAGAIVAVKGLGGFHLLVDAGNETAVRHLRDRKHREEKPLALMAPALAWAEEFAEVSPLEARLLRSPEAPIVLLRRRAGAATVLAPSVAPGNPHLGIMLPYTPLHHLLLRALGIPLVATSGNLSDEPICTDEHEALQRLQNIADRFLVHDRPIARHVDDSVGRVLLGREAILRRARGYAPFPVHLEHALPSVLGVGAHLKNAVAVSTGQDVFLSQHVGDLETPEALGAFRRATRDLATLYELKPEAVACDLHPDYVSTRHAEATGLPVVRVQHHYAHVASCMAENGITGTALGVSWDGTGYGPDHTVWGGEFLRITADGFERAAHLRTFRLPGGERAVTEPRRAALGLLYEYLGPAAFEREDLAPVRDFPVAERRIMGQALAAGINAPVTSSAGRLFDAIAALIGVRLVCRFEGQAAMELEWALDPIETGAYPFRLDAGSPAVLDWEPLVRAVVSDVAQQLPPARISARFHNTLAEMIVAVARAVGERVVLLSGGCFQNRYLTEQAVHRLGAAGFAPAWHQRVPPNDGGIALGQILAACRLKESNQCAWPSPEKS
jgi:hydrogenase maturation protein HypF